MIATHIFIYISDVYGELQQDGFGFAGIVILPPSPAAMPNLPIILGSTSKWRQRVLREHGYTFTTAAADIDEKAVNGGFADRSVVV